MNIKRFFHYLTIREHSKVGRWFSRGVRATIVTTTRCPLSCDYCPMYIYGMVKRYDESTFEEWKVWLDRFPYWVSHFYVSGGEPSLYKDIVPLVNYLIERGHHVTVFTNLWKIENFDGIKPHWRLLFQPTFHKHEDDLDRFTWAKEKMGMQKTGKMRAAALVGCNTCSIA